MISRRLFGLGVIAATTTVLASPAEARSILYLFGEREEPVIYRRLPGQPAPVIKRKVNRNGPKARGKLASKSKKKANGKSFKINPIYEPQQVDYYGPGEPGEIIVNSSEKFLYLVQPGGTARRYGVAIGKEGLGWTGTATIKAKVEWPSWRPTDDMIKRSPEKYARYKDGMPGGPGNPLGARALYFYQGKRDIAIRIHGTTQPWTIGSAASNGCFRMVNEHVIDLYRRVRIGTIVTVI